MSEETSTPVLAAATHAAPARGGRLASWARPVPMLALALVASLLFSAFLLLRESGGTNDDERQELVAVAETYAVNLTTYDHTRLDADFARVMEVATGQFRTQYEVAQQSLRELIVKFEGKATGTVLARAVLGLEGEQGEVLLFVDQTVTNNNAAQPKIDRLRMRMGLERQAGRWMINKLDLV